MKKKKKAFFGATSTGEEHSAAKIGKDVGATLSGLAAAFPQMLSGLLQDNKTEKGYEVEQQATPIEYDNTQMLFKHGGKIEKLSNNPYDSGTIKFNGPSHENGGIDFNFKGNNVEVEGEETAFIEDNNTMHIFGNMKVPGTNKKFKDIVNDIGKEESKINNKIRQKPSSTDDVLASSTKKLMNNSYRNQLKYLSDKKSELASIQNMMLAHSEALGMNPGDYAKKFKKGGSVSDLKSLFANNATEGLSQIETNPLSHIEGVSPSRFASFRQEPSAQVPSSLYSFTEPKTILNKDSWARKFKTVEDRASQWFHSNKKEDREKLKGAIGSFGYLKNGHLKEAYNSLYFNNIRKEFGDYNSFWKSLYHSGYSPLSEKVDASYEQWLKKVSGGDIEKAARFNLTGSFNPKTDWMVGNNITWQKYSDKIKKAESGISLEGEDEKPSSFGTAVSWFEKNILPLMVGKKPKEPNSPLFGPASTWLGGNIQPPANKEGNSDLSMFGPASTWLGGNIQPPATVRENTQPSANKEGSLHPETVEELSTPKQTMDSFSPLISRGLKMLPVYFDKPVLDKKYTEDALIKLQKKGNEKKDKNLENKLSPLDFMGEAKALIDQPKKTVLPYMQPTYAQGYNVSMDAARNQVRNSSNKYNKLLQNNPAALSNLYATELDEINKINSQEFSANQQIANSIYNANQQMTAQTNQFNIGQQNQAKQFDMQAEANTNRNKYAALASIGDKINKNKKDNMSMNMMENLSNMKFNPETGKFEFTGETPKVISPVVSDASIETEEEKKPKEQKEAEYGKTLLAKKYQKYFNKKSF